MSGTGGVRVSGTGGFELSGTWGLGCRVLGGVGSRPQPPPAPFGGWALRVTVWGLEVTLRQHAALDYGETFNPTPYTLQGNLAHKKQHPP